MIDSDDFMCRCSDESSAECEAVIAKARTLCKWRGSDDELADFDLIDSMMGRLSLDGEVSYIQDQWGAVTFKEFIIDPQTHKLDAAKGRTCFIQCDRFVDGLAALYLWWEEQKALDKADKVET